MEEIIVISLGGSLIVPEKIDTDFLRDFKSLIISHRKEGASFKNKELLKILAFYELSA